MREPRISTFTRPELFFDTLVRTRRQGERSEALRQMGEQLIAGLRESHRQLLERGPRELGVLRKSGGPRRLRVSLIGDLELEGERPEPRRIRKEGDERRPRFRLSHPAELQFAQAGPIPLGHERDGCGFAGECEGGEGVMNVFEDERQGVLLLEECVLLATRQDCLVSEGSECGTILAFQFKGFIWENNWAEGESSHLELSEMREG